jgi:hypothetical protein
LDRTPKREPRTAQMALRFQPMPLRPPRALADKYGIFELNVVEVREIDAPPEFKAVHWVE